MDNLLTNKAYNFNIPFKIALDGPSASGKGTIGKILAEQFSLVYFQSSLVYRGLAKLLLDKNVELDNVIEIIRLSKQPKIIKNAQNLDLNNEEIGAVASKIASISEVRKNLSLSLKQIIKQTHRIIMEGRDIGTVIAPEADLKIYITARIEIRVERRYKQLIASGKECIIGKIFDQLKERDERDQTRADGPLKPAENALIIDTSDLTIEDVIEKIKKYIS